MVNPTGKGPFRSGPFKRVNESGPTQVPAGRVRVSQQSLEVIHSGGDNRVRVSQVALEVIHSGGDNRIRVSQAYLEVIHEFGTPPPTGPGKSGEAPGHNKPPAQSKNWFAFQERLKKAKRQKSGFRFQPDIIALSPDSYVPLQLDSVQTKEKTKIILRG